MYNPSFPRFQLKIYTSVRKKKKKQEMNFTLASPAPSVPSPSLLFLFVTDCDNSIISFDNPSPWHGWLQFLFWRTKV